MEVNREFDFKQDWKFYFNLRNVILGRNSLFRFYFVSFCKLWSVLWKTFHKPIRKHLWQVLFFIKFLDFYLGIFQSFLLNLKNVFSQNTLNEFFFLLLTYKGKSAEKYFSHFVWQICQRLCRKRPWRTLWKT